MPEVGRIIMYFFDCPYFAKKIPSSWMMVIGSIVIIAFALCRCGEMLLYRFFTLLEWPGVDWSLWPVTISSTTTCTGKHFIHFNN